MFNSKKRVKDLSAPGSASGPAGSASNAAAAGGGGMPGAGPPSAGNIQKLEMAKRLALKINAQKNLGAEAQVRQVDTKKITLIFHHNIDNCTDNLPICGLLLQSVFLDDYKTIYTKFKTSSYLFHFHLKCARDLQLMFHVLCLDSFSKQKYQNKLFLLYRT